MVIAASYSAENKKRLLQVTELSKKSPFRTLSRRERGGLPRLILLPTLQVAPHYSPRTCRGCSPCHRLPPPTRAADAAPPRSNIVAL